MSTPDPASVAAAKREALDGLASVVGRLANSLEAQGDAAKEIATLAARAERLAGQAWEFSKERRAPAGGGVGLAKEVAAFIDYAATLTERASAEAAATREVAVILTDGAAALNDAARVLDGVNDVTLIRAKLRPILATLGEVPMRLTSMKGISTDIVSLGDRARQLADRIGGLNENSLTAAVAAVAIYRELRELTNAAAAIAAGLLKDDRRIRQSVAAMKDRALQLSHPEAAAAQPNATALLRMRTLIEQGTAAGRRTEPSSATDPAGAIYWGDLQKRRIVDR